MRDHHNHLNFKQNFNVSERIIKALNDVLNVIESVNKLDTTEREIFLKMLFSTLAISKITK